MSEMGETNEMREKREKLGLIIKSIRRTRNKLAAGFAIFLAIGIAALVGGIVNDELGTAAIVIGAVCVLLAVVGVKIIWPNRNPEKAPLVRLLLEHPEKVAWIFTAQDPGSGGIYGKSRNVNVNDTDKKCYTFAVKEKLLDEVMETLKSFAPRAAVGLDDETLKKFQQDPWSVMSDS